MKSVKVIGRLRNRAVAVALLFWSICLWPASAALEQTFDVLQVGTTTYRNVTVTTKSKNYVFILHSKGMTNLKVADLTAELKEKLGYDDPASHPKTNAATAWAKQTLARLDVPQATKIREQLTNWYSPRQAAEKLRLPPVSQNTLLLCAAGLFGLYLFHCFCCRALCQKCGFDPGLLIWLPVVQLFPLLKAAEMPLWWFIVFLIPGINLLAQIVWFFKIANARGKGFGVALLLIFPLTSPFAMLYLAFSGNRAEKKESPRRVAIMTLETA